MNRMKKLTADAVGISELLCSELWSNPPTWSPESWTQVCQWLRDAGVNALNKVAIGTEPCELPTAEPAARTEQPTPQPFYCHCCGKIATCPECELKYAPAAPVAVVEPRREHATNVLCQFEFWLDGMITRWTPHSPVSAGAGQMYETLKQVRDEFKAIGKREADSQRKEGAGQK